MPSSLMSGDFEAFYTHWYPHIRNYCHKVKGFEQPTLDDLMQEIFLRIWIKSAKYDPAIGDEKTYIWSQIHWEVVSFRRRLAMMAMHEPTWVKEISSSAALDAYYESDSPDGNSGGYVGECIDEHDAYSVIECNEALASAHESIKANGPRGLVGVFESLARRINYGVDVKQTDIAVELGVTRQRVGQQFKRLVKQPGVMDLRESLLA